jgi:shikimate kinase
MRIFIIGYMSAGKSTVGKRLANRINMPFIDLDDVFEAKFRYSIPRFFDHFGEEKFREFEHTCLKEIISENDHAVISTGGGTACHHGNIDIMNSKGLTIYLKMHPSSLTQRLNMARRLRPVIRDVEGTDMRNFIEEQLAEREQYYIKATITVKGESLDLDGLVEQLRRF